MKDYTSICKAMKVPKPVKIITLCQKWDDKITNDHSDGDTPSLLSYDKLPREAELPTQ